MNILVVGATGSLGREVLSGLTRRGHAAAALARTASKPGLPVDVELVVGDVLNPDSLRAAVLGRDAVICALGTPSPRQPSTLLRDGTANLIEAMQTAGVGRLVCVSLLGLGASRANTSLFYREVILRVLAPMMADKQAQEEVVTASGLDWTIVRPPRFTAGSGRVVHVLREGQAGRFGHIHRGDLAELLVTCVAGGMHRGEAIAVGSTTFKRAPK